MLKKIPLYFLVLLWAAACETSSAFVKRETPDSTFATAKKGDLVYSTTDFRMNGNKYGVIYKNWKFERADKKSVYLIYEEHNDFVKIQPDLKQEVSYDYGPNFQVKIQGMVLTIYRLTDKDMVYYIKSEK